MTTETLNHPGADVSASDSAAKLQALLDAELTPEQKVHLDDAKAHLREFLRIFGPYGTLAVTLLSTEFTDAFLARARAAGALPEKGTEMSGKPSAEAASGLSDWLGG